MFMYFNLKDRRQFNCQVAEVGAADKSVMVAQSLRSFHYSKDIVVMVEAATEHSNSVKH